MLWTTDYANNFFERQGLPAYLRLLLTPFFSMTFSPLLAFSASLCLFPALHTVIPYREFFFSPLRYTARKIIVKSETRGWGWRSFEGNQILAGTPGGDKAAYYPDSGANRQTASARVIQSSPYQSTPYFLSPKYKGGLANNHHLCFLPCVGLSLWACSHSSCHTLWIKPDSFQVLNSPAWSRPCLLLQ